MRLKNQALFQLVNRLIFPLFYLRHQRQEVAVVPASPGTRFNVRVNSSDILVLWEIWKFHIYDDARFPIQPDSVVVDLGAHIGAFAIRAARQAYRGRVLAYEASQANFNLLVANQRLNGVHNLSAAHAAVWDHAGTLDFYQPSANGALGSVLQEACAARETVTATTLDELVEQNALNRIDCLKIDTEGAEYPILFGASVTTLRRVNYIVLEYHEWKGMARGRRDLETFLRAMGFTVAASGGLFPQKLLFGTGCLRAWRALPGR